jgi:hypothetical protein
MAFDTTQIQGAYVSWANIGISLETYGGPSFRTSDFAAIDWDHGLEPSDVPGTGPMTVGRTIGMYKKSASMTMYMAKAYDFQKALQAIKPGVGFMLIPFDLMAQWEPLDGDGAIFSVRLIACRIMSEASKNAPGGDANTLEMPLSISHIEKIHPDGTVLRPF